MLWPPIFILNKAYSIFGGLSSQAYAAEIISQSFTLASSVLWDRIVKIELLAPEKVWDIEVEGTHNFIGNDIIAHNTYLNGNVGVGTSTPQGALVVTSGNVGIGTWVPSSILQLGSNPAGSTSQTNFTLNAGTSNTMTSSVQSVSGVFQVTTGGTYVGSSSAGSNTTLGFIGGAAGGGTYINFSHNGSNSGLHVTHNNGSDLLTVDSGGNLGVGTALPSTLLEVGAQKFNVTSAGNVGIGSLAPGQKLDVSGTVRATAFSGDGSALTGLPATGGWTLGASNVGISTTNNVGIGTSLTTLAGLSVMNGNVGIGTWVPHSTFMVQGSQALGLRSVSVDTTLNSTYYTVLVDSTASPITITLPTAVGISGRYYRIKDWKGQSAINNISMATTGGQTLDGVGTLVISIAYQEIEFCSDGANWVIF